MLPFHYRSPVLVNPHLKLPTVLLSRYLFFLTRRPISSSNTHYLQSRIHGLQSLAEFLDGGTPATEHARQVLRCTTPANFVESAERLQITLAPLAQTAVPRDYITTTGQVTPDFVTGSQRILVVFGPAIGIGDEIMAYPFPGWIKAAKPEASVTVLSAYAGLWRRVAGADHVSTYTDHAQLIAAIRGSSELGDFDLVILIDFENPELYQAVTYESGIARYAEISLGAQVMAAVDNRRQWIYRPQRLAADELSGFYRGLVTMAKALRLDAGIGERYWEAAKASEKTTEGELRIWVSPFSSKYDPSPRYWSRLLASLGRQHSGISARVLVEPGPNRATRRFAADVVRAARALTRAENVDISVADADSPRGLTLDGVFEELDRSHVVVCADSFTAHAAPAMGCTTLVVASPGLERWRVPHPRSFYFDSEASLPDVLSGMGVVLAQHGLGLDHPPSPALEAACDRLGRSVTELQSTLGGDDEPLESMTAAFDRFVASRADVIEQFADSAQGKTGLASDYTYHLPLRAMADESLHDRDEREAVVQYMTAQLQEWQGTNVAKYLASVRSADPS